MPKRKVTKSSSNDLTLNKHHLIPSTIGGVVAYLFSGAVALAVGVAVVVWIVCDSC